jgi:nucleoside-diphosphate-sugar epimerase
MIMSRNIFITGASGFLGKDLVRSLSQDNQDYFYFLSRSERTDEVLRDTLKSVDRERLRILRGDITLPYLGLTRRELIELSKKVNEFWHLAASTSFDESKRAEIEQVNLGGTENVLRTLGSFDKLKDFFYMSTAYVCGKKQGEIPEGEFTTDSFKNPYEASKFKCEHLVRRSGLPYTIVRPSIMIGDSRTGDSKGEKRMIYGYLLALYYSSLHKFGGEKQFWEHYSKGNGEGVDVDARLLGDAGTTKNLVALDDVVNVCRAIRHSPDHQGRTYNVVNPRNLEAGAIINSMQRALKISGFAYSPDFSEETPKRNSVERAAFKYTKPFWPYARISEPQWQYGNVSQLGVKRVEMTGDLFDFLMQQFVDRELAMKNGN